MRRHFALALGLAACTPVYPAVNFAHVNVVDTQAKSAAPDFEAVRDRWTRRVHLNHEWDTAIDGHVVLLSDEMRVALVGKMSDMMKLAEAERATLVAQQAKDAAEMWELVFLVDTSRFEWNDFSASKTVWSLTLADDAGHLIGHPEIIIAPEKPTMIEALYPWTGPFTRTFRVRFPRAIDGKPTLADPPRALTLRIAGPLGAVDARWESEPAP